MTDREWTLTTLAEECMELGQRITKALRFGIHEVQEGQELDNLERINQEFNDVLGTAEVLRLQHDLHILVRDETQVSAKIKKVIKYKQHAIREGVIFDEDEDVAGN
jgi:NTP pyrophosphatase (non-canonical NTP hydrolase)